MKNLITKAVDALLNVETVQAHCDIPCAIYDPSTATVAALSVVRIMDIMIEKSAAETQTLAVQNTLSRCVYRKEEEAEKVKHEIRIIWGDYFKDPQVEKYPDTHQLVHQIMRKASACKQQVNRQDALDLVDLVNQFSASFWAAKNVPTKRSVCPYPPALEVVYPVL